MEEIDPFESLSRATHSMTEGANKNIYPLTMVNRESLADQEVKNKILQDAENIKRLNAYHLLKVSQAQTDPCAFLEFVMREETTRRKIKTTKHQKVVIDFVMAHEQCVLMLPAGHSKTFMLATISLFLMGRNPTLRGAIVSDTQTQAEKPLSMVRDYIEHSSTLKLVFPHLKPSTRPADSWTQTEITVDRPPGIRDSSLIAVGYHGAISGARLSWVIVDDLVSPENVHTKESRDQLYEWFDGAVLSRLDPKGARAVVSNTAWDKDDLPHRLKTLGWPTLKMDILGGIEIFNTDWDTDDIRPAKPGSTLCRLAGRGDNDLLFPERYDHAAVNKLRTNHLPHRFNQLYMNQVGDAKAARCKLEWIEKCKAKGRGLTLSAQRDNGNLRICGVDIAISESEASHDSCLFTIEVLPTGERLIVDIDVGKYDGPTLVNKIIANHKRYNSFVHVESNAAQAFLRQFTLEKDISIPITNHFTGANKFNVSYGVESLFLEFYNGAWIIPNDIHGRCHPTVQRFLDACHYYQPSKHTDDTLMAAWFAREKARKIGYSLPDQGESLSTILDR